MTGTSWFAGAQSGASNWWNGLRGYTADGIATSESALRRAGASGASPTPAPGTDPRVLRSALNNNRLGVGLNNSRLGTAMADSRLSRLGIPTKAQPFLQNKWVQGAGKWGGGIGVGLMGISDVGAVTKGGITNGWSMDGSDSSDPNKWLALGNGIAMGGGAIFGGAAGAAAAGAAWNALANENNFAAINNTIGDGSYAARDAAQAATVESLKGFDNVVEVKDANGVRTGYTGTKTMGGTGNIYQYNFDADGGVLGRTLAEKPKEVKPLPTVADMMAAYAQYAPDAQALPADVVASLATSAEQRKAALSDLDARYSAQTADLKKNYSFSETAAEKATLAKLMAGYEKKYKRSKEEVEDTYAGLTSDAREMTEQVRADRNANASAVQEIWASAANDAAAAAAYARGEGNTLAGGDIGVNTAAGTDANAQAAIANLASQGAEAATTATRYGNDAVRSSESHTETLGEQRGAQRYWLGRDYDSLVDSTTAAHAHEVAARINAEKQAYASLASQLAAQRLQAVQGLESQYHTDDTNLAQLRATWAQQQNANQQAFWQGLLNTGMTYELENARNSYAGDSAAAAAAARTAAGKRGDWWNAMSPEDQSKASQAKWGSGQGLS